MSQIDDFLSGKSPNTTQQSIDDFLGESPQKERENRKSQASAMDYVRAADSAIGQGIAGIAGGIGTFIQDPAANSLSGVTAAAHLADRGVTWLMKQAGADSELNPTLQEHARMASRFAAESRDAQAKDPSNLPARLGRYLQDDSERAVREIKASDQARNPELIAQQRNMAQAEGFVDNLKAVTDNPLALTHTLIRSVPDMAIGVGVGSTLHRAGASLGKVSTGGMLSEAGSSAMQGRQGVYQQVAEMPIETLAQSPRFQEVLKETGGDAGKARLMLANELADQVPLLTGAGTAAGTLVANRLFGGDATAKSIAGVDRMTKRELGKRIAQDTAEEGIQGVPEDAVQHGATVQADPNQKYDPAGSLAQNLVAGFAMGSGGHGFAYGRERLTAKDGTGDVGNKLVPPDSPAAPSAPVNVSAPAQSTVGGVATNDTTQAEKALLEPKSLTALDRVTEIDGEDKRLAERLDELNKPDGGYGPMFDAERDEIRGKRGQFEAERLAIVKHWPAAVSGAQTTFSTEAGVHLGAQYALMEAGDLTTSHDESLRANPTYPQKLQPRERDRAASEMQVSGIVQRLDPARLGLSADAATGAPIVGADGLVESGNARSIALKRIYQANGQKAADYKAYLEANADQFGITPESVQGMQKPVLVRVRNTPVNRAEFARQANASTVAQMSPSEQAKSDANRIDVMDDLEPDDSGDFSGAASRGFVRRFLSKLPGTEQAGMIDASGNLSTSGYTRIRNAVLAKAYGDSPVLMRMTESMDDNLRNVSKALVTAAPRVAQMRQAMKDGNRFDADITPDLMSAVEELSRLKDSGTSVQDALAQAGMFGDKYSDETKELLQFLADNMRRPRRMADFITAYMEALDAAGDPNQGSLLGDVTPPAKGELLSAARRTVNEGTANDGGSNAQDTQRRDAGENTAPDKQAGGQPQDAQSGSGGNQGDGPARTPAGDETRLARGKDLSRAEDARAKAVEDFNAAAADLAEILIKRIGGKAMMVPENTPNLMPTLVKLFESAIKVVGTDMKAAVKWVKDKLKEDPKFKTTWNKIGNDLYQKAALKAIEKHSAAADDAGDEGDKAVDLPKDAEPSPDTFIKSPDGSIDFGEITPEMSKAMRRQAGKIRLQQGIQNPNGTGYGVAHIEANHGKQIRKAGFKSVEDFVGHVAGKFNEIFQVASGRQLLVAVTNGRRDIMFVQLEAADDDDFYRVNTAFPASRDYLEKQEGKGAKVLWEGSEPLSTAAGQQPLYAGKPDELSGQATPIAQGQSIESLPERFAKNKADSDPAKPPLTEETKQDADPKPKDEKISFNKAVYSRSDTSVLKPPSEWITDTVIADEVEKRIGRFAHKPTIRIRDTARGQLPGVTGNDNVSGAAHDGAIYLFRDQLADRAAVQRTLFHELLHYGLRRLMTREQFTADMLRLYERDSSIKKFADDWAKSNDGAHAASLHGADYALARGVDEALATLAEPNAGEFLQQGLYPALVRKVTAWLADVAEKMDFRRVAAYLRSIKSEEARAYIKRVFARLENDSDMGEDWSNAGEAAFGRAVDNLDAEKNPPSVLSRVNPDGTGIHHQAGMAETLRRVVESVNLSSKSQDSGSNDVQPKLSRGPGAGTQPLDFASLQALASKIQKSMPNMPKVTVLKTPASAPAALKQYILQQGAWDDVEGAMHDGQFYLFASGLSDEARAEHVLAEHEAAHFGLRAVVGKSLNTAMNLIYAGNANVRRAATELQKRGKLTNAEATEEVIVDIPTSQLASLKGWRKVVIMARDAMAAKGYTKMAEKLTTWLDGTLTEQQRADLFVADLVRSARDYMAGRREGSPSGVRGVTRLSGTLADDIAKQEQWLQTEAKARGFKDIEDLLEKDYATFENLATLWRKKNPADGGVMLSRAEENAYAKAVRLWQATLGSNPKPGTSIDMPMPTALRAMGAKFSALTLPVRYLQGIVETHADLPKTLLQDLPQLLSDPVVMIPYAGGGYRVLIDAQTSKGDPIIVGIREDGRIQTVTPMHGEKGVSGRDYFANLLEQALATSGAKVYARNKEALAKTRASQGFPIGTFNPNQSPFTRAVPATIALHRSPRDKAILRYRDQVVKTEGDFGPGIRLSRAAPEKTAAERARALMQSEPSKRSNVVQRGKEAAVAMTESLRNDDARLELLDAVTHKLKDRFVDLKWLQGQIAQSGGTLSELNDAYRGEELYHGRAATAQDVFLRDELKPMLEQMQRAGIGLEQMEAYLHAQHAPEANAELAKRNLNEAQLEEKRAAMDAQVKDLELALQRAVAAGTASQSIEWALDEARAERSQWRSAQAFAGTEAERTSLSGMSDDEAADIMAAVPDAKRVAYEALAKKVSSIIAGTRSMQVAAGLITQAQANEWANLYAHYVPLHRDEAHPASHIKMGQGFSVKGKESRSRTGSQAKVTNILAHVAAQREQAITRGEKNLVAKRLWLLAAQNPMPDVWTLEKPKSSHVDAQTGLVVSGVDPNYLNKPNVLVVKIAGKDHAIVFNERNERAMRLVGELKNLDAPSLDGVTRMAAQVTRWLASVNTQYNPVFGVINFARDVQAAGLQLTTTALNGKQGEVMRGSFPAFGAIWRAERGKVPSHKADAELAALWREMQAAGGMTGYRDVFANIEDRVKALDKMLAENDRGKLAKAGAAGLDVLNDYNTAMEGAVRLSAYQQAKAMGLSVSDAASLAKNLTVNFNRKGTMGRSVAPWYAFFNAAVQGSTRMIQTLRGPMGKRIMAGGVLLGMVTSLLSMAMMGGGGDDDDKDKQTPWQKIPDFVKERSLILGWGADYIAVPMPLGYNLFTNAGRVLAEQLAGQGRPGKGVGDALVDVLSMAVGAFNPVGGSDLASAVTPTPADWAVDLLRNKDWTGRDIAREDTNKNDPTPGHSRAKDSATPWAKSISRGANWVTGGTEYQPGVWSPTPDQIDYVIGQLTGGVGREAGKLVTTASSPFTADELPANKIPLVSRVYGNTRSPQAGADLFYENVRKANELENEILGRRKSGESLDGVPNYAFEVAGRGNNAEKVVRRLRQLRKHEVKTEADGYKDRVKEIDARIGVIMDNFNRDVNRARRLDEQVR